MTSIKTRLQYDESVLNHIDSVSIIAKHEKMAVKHGLYNDVKVRIDSEGIVFYDIRVYVRTCKENDDGQYMYLYFQYVPSSKYFEVSNWNEVIENYPPVNKYLDDTAMCKALNFAAQLSPFSWEKINDFLALITHIAKQESTLYLEKRD